jgi:predicted nucleotidyltransferase
MAEEPTDVGVTFEGLSRVFAAYPDVELALVFGSVASGRAHAGSDLDVAVFSASPLTATRKAELIRELALVTGRPVDLVDLRVSGPAVTLAALRGKRLVCRNERAYPALLSRALIDAADFLPLRERTLRERRDAWIR